MDDAIIYGQGVGGQEWIFHRGTSEKSVNLKPRLMLSAAEGVREAVLNGQGFAISSRWISRQRLHRAQWFLSSKNGVSLQWTFGLFILRGG